MRSCQRKWELHQNCKCSIPQKSKSNDVHFQKNMEKILCQLKSWLDMETKKGQRMNLNQRVEKKDHTSVQGCLHWMHFWQLFSTSVVFLAKTIMTTSKPCATLSRVIQLLRTVFKRCCISCQDDNFTALCTSFNGYLAITIKKVKGERTLRIREPPFEKWSMYLSIAQIAFNPRPINIVRDIVRDGGSTAP